ncbi:cypmaclein-like [Cornus florida]|uniref:cypmaclein-like n=1 Tax=Cornus florida TaxID=4283 RepID=UPI0028A0CA86|nr:cypmaclein-like [Cornus florida]
MAPAKATLALALLCFLLVQEMEVFSGQQLSVDAQQIDCKGKCAFRCSKAKAQKMCIRSCNSCCEKCNCVPPGTSMNREMCPCYAGLTTHGGKPKCP